MRWSRTMLALAAMAVALAGSCGVRVPDDRVIAADYLGRVMSRNVVRGRNRYEVVCVPCHGDHDERQGPLLASLHWTPPQIRHQVREGNSLMPSIPRDRLTDDDLEHLLAFLLTTGACVADDDGFGDDSADGEGHAGAEAQAEAETDARAEAHAGAETHAEAEAYAEAEAHAEAQAQAQPEAEAEAEAEARAEAEAQADAEAETRGEADAGPPVDAGVAPAPDAGVWQAR